jgi:hypothetical protein
LISEENERALYIRKAQQEFLADLEGKVLDDINLTIEGYVHFCFIFIEGAGEPIV